VFIKKNEYKEALSGVVAGVDIEVVLGAFFILKAKLTHERKSVNAVRI